MKSFHAGKKIWNFKRNKTLILFVYIVAHFSKVIQQWKIWLSIYKLSDGNLMDHSMDSLFVIFILEKNFSSKW